MEHRLLCFNHCIRTGHVRKQTMNRSIPRITIASFLCLTVVLGCGTQSLEVASELHSPSAKQSSSHQANNESLAGVQHPTKLTIADPISYNNLTVFPIVSDRSLSDDQFITLDEGLASGKVEVFEGGGDDNPFGGDEERDTSLEDPFGADDQDGSSDSDPISDSPSTNQTPASEGGLGGTETLPANFQPLVDLIKRTMDDDAWHQMESDDSAINLRTEGGQSVESDEVELDDEVADGSTPNETVEDIANNSVQSGGDTNQSVDTLFVRNEDEKPLYLMPGEIVLGGDQDRMIAEECIVPPGSTKFAIKVFCVEQGRWAQRDHERTVAELMVANNVTERNEESTAERQNETFTPNLSLIVSQTQEIQQGKFVGGVGAVTNSVRKAAQIDQSQQGVWASVATENIKSNVKSDSNSFTANFCDEETVQRLQPYLESLTKQVAGTPKVVGVVIAINGEVESLDHFNSTPLFKKLWPKLLKGFALQAVNVADESNASEVVSLHEAEQFLAKTEAAAIAQKEENESLVTERRESDGLVCFSSRLKSLSEQATEASSISSAHGVGVGGGGFGGGGYGGGGAIHSSAFQSSSR